IDPSDRPSCGADGPAPRCRSRGPTLRSRLSWNHGTGVRLQLEGGKEAVRASTMEADRHLTFEGFALDVVNEQLLRGDEIVALTPKAFAVLRCLVEHGGQLVKKEALLRAGWADTHVTDAVLKVSILEIRRALGDAAAAPRFTETVPRRGYRFVAPRTPARRTPGSAVASDGLVGRDGVLATLDERLERARAGRRQLVFLSGEAGI